MNPVLCGCLNTWECVVDFALIACMELEYHSICLTQYIGPSLSVSIFYPKLHFGVELVYS